ncbi:MAG: cupin-like domain-containing protein [Bacteroidota bacterium]
MELETIPRVKGITKLEFVNTYFKLQKPVIIEDLAKDWPAYSKWDLEYVRKVAGDKIVPLYDDRPVHHKDGFNEPHDRMRMSDYIDLLKSRPTRYRIFLWNVLREVPELQRDFTYPDLGLRLLKKLPMLFFGGSDSHTFMHYDIDLANILHFHFEGKKECILFSREQTKYLYKVPHSLITHEGIDFSRPDFNKWPALKNAKGHHGFLNHGEVLYMPEGYWHHMRYVSPGFSMSLRALPRNPKNLATALYNVVIMRHYDGLMRRIKGQDWIDQKNRKAISNTHGAMVHH